MDTTLDLALINLKDGLNRGADLHRLPQLFASYQPVGPRPALVMVNEAKWWHDSGRAEHRAAWLLSQMFGAPYGIRIGKIERSDDPPAVLYDTTRLRLLSWADPRSQPHVWGRNTAEFAWATGPDRVALRVQLAHLDYASGTRRLAEAETLAAQITQTVPLIVAGDMNSTASGPHLPARDFSQIPAEKRRQKGRLVNGAWMADTRALDVLIGAWDPATGTRVHGAGLSSLAEEDWHQRARPDALPEPTTNTSQPLLIDWILRNSRLELLPRTYRVHPPGKAAVSDHRLITAAVRCTA